MTRMATVVRPGTYRPDRQFTAQDYVSVPAISLRGTFRVVESMRLTADPRLQSERHAQAVIGMMTKAVDRMGDRR